MTRPMVIKYGRFWISPTDVSGERGTTYSNMTRPMVIKYGRFWISPAEDTWYNITVLWLNQWWLNICELKLSLLLNIWNKKLAWNFFNLLCIYWKVSLMWRNDPESFLLEEWSVLRIVHAIPLYERSYRSWMLFCCMKALFERSWKLICCMKY